MACDVTYAELAEYSAGELEDERASVLSRHVPECERCRRRLELLRTADAALQALPRVKLPAHAALNTRRALAREIRGATPEIMTLDEVADFLRIDVDDLEEIASELPAFELAGRVRVRRARLIEWIEQRERRYAMSTLESDVARSVSRRFAQGVA